MTENPNVPVDLHVHSNFSDGELDPHQLIEYACNRGVGALAITDHDTVRAYQDPELNVHARSADLELVTGVEISTESGDFHFHVLGLCIDTEEPELLGWLDGLRQSREKYTADVIAKLVSFGWHVDAESLPQGQVHTKAHVSNSVIADQRNAERLRTLFGHTPKRGEFIERYMNPGQECYVPRILPSPRDVIGIIHRAGGLAFMAHPVAYLYEQGMTAQQIKDAVISDDYDGLEAIYYYYFKSGGDIEIDKIGLFKETATQSGLLISGGSDFHGSSPIVGNYMDIGYNGKPVFPTLALLRTIQSAAEQRRRW